MKLKINRHERLIGLLMGIVASALFSCKQNKSTPEIETPQRPNIILIMADDMGYECLGAYGGLSYETPELDRIAQNGLQFANCVSQPLCTPSRVKIMTGLYNYRNYEHFGFLGDGEYTFGNIMKNAGYATCIAGKWQLNGLLNDGLKNYWDDASRPHGFGFDEYSLWQLTKDKRKGERYANPLIEQNGKFLPRNDNDYGPEIVSNFVLDFIERKKDSPFFVYYPMVLPHSPFTPTPDSEGWPANKNKRDTVFFKDMIAYTDKIVGNIVRKLEALKIEENTILIFTGDNGTNQSILTQTKTGPIWGGKGTTLDTGTHVPLLVYWPQTIAKGSVYEGLIEFSDFFSTLADIAGVEADSDGKSFFPLLKGDDYDERQTVLVDYRPYQKDHNKNANRFVQSSKYKLYRDGKFFDLFMDKVEKHPLDQNTMTPDQKEAKAILQAEMDKHPVWK